METVNETKARMKQSVDHLSKELSNLRAQRPSPSILDTVTVEVYGTEMRVRDVASISAGDGRNLLITPFDPQTAGAIGKGIEKANLGLKPIVEGNIVRVPIPPLSGEMRKQIVKEAKEKTEKAKVAIRDHRRKANDALKSQKQQGAISEDEQKKREKLVQELTDRFCKEVDTLCIRKEKDILEV